MSLSYRIALERLSKKLQRLVKRFEGDALPRWKNEREISEGLGLTPLTGFVSMTPDEVREYAEFRLRLDGTDTSAALEAFCERWFEPSDGLATVRGLIRAVEADKGLVQTRHDVSMADAVLIDLKDLETILVAAEAEGVRFHLTG
jgi:hypothetical protein